MTATPKTEIHDGWLQLEQMMQKRLGTDLWSQLKQPVQCAYYMGSMASLVAKGTHKNLFKQTESGLADALGKPNLRLVRVAP